MGCVVLQTGRMSLTAYATAHSMAVMSARTRSTLHIRHARRWRRIVTAALAAPLVALVLASPAQASATRASQVSPCTVFLTSCNTNAIPANSSGHYVLLELWAGGSGRGCSFRIRDVNSWVVVMSGRVGAFAYGKFYVGGLYGWYRGELYNCATNATADIYNW